LGKENDCVIAHYQNKVAANQLSENVDLIDVRNNGRLD
jgi:hypothetical protein